MNITDAKKEIIIKRIIGALIGITGLISTIISLLKMLYFRIDVGTPLGGVIAKPFKLLIGWGYKNTQPFLSWFWHNSPVPDHLNLATSENAYFICIYILIFVGIALFTSGNKLARRLGKIREKIEDQIIEESMKGKNQRSFKQIESETEIPKTSIFSQFHQLYLAPIIVGLIVALLLKLMSI